MRVDRLATLYLALPMKRILQGDGEKAVPILMYHSISDNPERASHPYFQTNTDPATFRKHMEWLAINRYRSIPLRKIEEELARTVLENGKPFVITFDDGFRDFRENAFPVLRRFDFTATVFLATGYISRKLMDKECLAWEEIRELQGGGIEFGSHTVSHPKLHGMPQASLQQEFRDSKAAIEDATGKSVACFSYPYAFPQEDRTFISELGDALKRCGYTRGVTTCIGRATARQDLLFLKRIPLNMHDDESLLRAKLEGGYDWLRRAQYAYRSIKRWA